MPEATTSGSHSDFVAVKFDPGGGDMKVATINTRSVNIHTTEPLIPDTDGDGGERADAPPPVLLEIQLSHIQSRFEFLRRQNHTL